MNAQMTKETMNTPQLGAQELLQAGLDIYEKFISHSSQTEHLSQALRYLTSAIELDSALVSSYLILGQEKISVAGLFMAKEVFENLSDKSVPKDALLHQPFGFELQYALLKARIINEKKNLDLFLTEPTLNSEKLCLVEDRIDDLELFYEQALVEMSALDQECDVTLLYELLTPFQEMIQAQEALILSSYDLLEIADNLQILKTRTENLLKEDLDSLISILPLLQKTQIQQIQRIDYLKQEGHNTSELERDLMAWIWDLDSLQFILDSLKD